MQILDLKTQRNELARIFRLPSEILSAVFTHYAQAAPMGSYWRGTRMKWIDVAKVCRHWRDVALRCPHLWSDIDFTFLPPSMAPIMIERSKQALISLSIPSHLSFKAEPHAKSILSLQAHRFRTLTIRSGTMATTMMIQELTSPVLHLQRLILDAQDCHDDLPLPDKFLGGHAPELRELDLTGWRLPWTSPILSGLRTLELSLGNTTLGSHPPIDPADFVSAFERMSPLRVLTLRLELPFTDASGPLRVARLPHLEKLSFTGTFGDGARALKRLALPTSAVLAFECECGEDEFDYIFPNFGSALVSSWLSAPLTTGTNLESNHLRTMVLTNGLFQGWLREVAQGSMWDLNLGAMDANLTIFWHSAHSRHAPAPLLVPLLSDLPLDDVRRVDIQSASPSVIRHIGRLPRITSVYTSGSGSSLFFKHLKDGMPTKPIEGKPSPGYPTSVIAFSKLHTVYLEGMSFPDRDSALEDFTMDDLLDVLKWRYGMGGAIQEVHISECGNISEDDIARIREVVGDVEWDKVVLPGGEVLMELDDNLEYESDDTGLF